MKTHELKTWPEYFEPLKKGLKTFEVRNDDRGFEVGDTLILREWDFYSSQYTGRQVKRRVTYKMKGGKWGLDHHMCVLGLKVKR